MKTYRKEILKTGKWQHASAPNGVLEVTKDYLQRLKDNFSYSPFAPVLRGHVDNIEAEKNPSLTLSKNIKGLDIVDDRLIAEFEVDEKELDNYNDVSVSIDPEYKNKETGQIIGPMLKHVAMVLNPYIKGLGSFTALSENDNYLIYLSEITDMAKKEIKEEVKLEELVPTLEEVVEKTEETTEAQPEVVPTEVVEKTEEEVVEAPEAEVTEPEVEDEKEKEVVQASEVQDRIAELELQLAEANQKLLKGEADSSYKVLLSEGKIVPAQKEAYLKLHSLLNGVIELSDGTKEDKQVVLSEFFKNAPKIIELGESNTVEVSDDPNDEVKVAKASMRLLPTNAKMSDEEYDAYFEKNKETILKSLKK